MTGKTVFYTILGTIVFLIVVYMVGKSYGKYKPPASLPVPDDTPAGQAAFNPANLTDQLYEDIRGWSNPLNRNMEAWNMLASLSDTSFVLVLNDWDKRYYNKFRETLYQAYLKEKFNPLTSQNLLSALNKKFNRLAKPQP